LADSDATDCQLEFSIERRPAADALVDRHRDDQNQDDNQRSPMILK